SQSRNQPGARRPDGRLLGPLAVTIALLEIAAGFRECRMVSRLVPRDPGPIERLGSGHGFREVKHNFVEEPLRFFPTLVRERDLREPQLETRHEIVRRQVALEAIALDAIRIENDERRGPLRAEAL